MIKLDINGTISNTDLQQGVEFTTSNWVTATCIIEDNDVRITIESGYYWGRDDIKELIAFLKGVRKCLPKGDE